MKRDTWISLEDLRKEYENKPIGISFDSPNPVRCVLINTKGKESTAFKAIMLPRTFEYFGCGTEIKTSLTFVKPIEFKKASKDDIISHLLIEWDGILKVRKEFKQFPSGVKVREGDNIIVEDGC